VRYSIRCASACTIAVLYLFGAVPQQLAAREAADADAIGPERIPRAPDVAVMRWVGQYGSEDSVLTIYEDRGQLYADGQGLSRAPLRSAGATSDSLQLRSAIAEPSTLLLESDHGDPMAIRWNDRRLLRIDVGALVAARIRAKARADASLLRATALREVPPAEHGPRRPSELVSLASIPAVKFDIRYATSDNFMGFALYERPRAYLQRPAAEALIRVARHLGERGLGLMIYDAYRPWFVTKMFWDATPESAHRFVADPAQGSRHNRGCAVDLTLYRFASGAPVPMPGRYDEMSARSYADFIGGTSQQRGFRDLLRRAMEAEGFTVYPEEWWHFDYKDWDQYSIGNVSFDQLRAAEQPR
jgi:D-alanyl-D-alanine dipeptidase